MQKDSSICGVSAYHRAGAHGAPPSENPGYAHAGLEKKLKTCNTMRSASMIMLLYDNYRLITGTQRAFDKMAAQSCTIEFSQSSEGYLMHFNALFLRNV